MNRNYNVNIALCFCSVFRTMDDFHDFVPAQISFHCHSIHVLDVSELPEKAISNVVVVGL